MQTSKLITLMILISWFLVGCGAPVAEPSPTSVPSDTPVPTQPPPPTDTPPPTPEPASTPMTITTFEDLAGDWRRDADGITVKIKIDEEGKASATGIGAVTLWWEEDLLNWKEASFEGCPGTVAIYRITGVPGENIRIQKIEDPCNRRGVTGVYEYFGPP